MQVKSRYDVIAVANKPPPGSPAESSEIYVGDNYDENYDISLFERGRCTDSYSKAWCDSHGFANNRTVPHKVKLNAKEEACLRDPYLAGTAEVIAGLVTTGPNDCGQVSRLSLRQHKELVSLAIACISALDFTATLFVGLKERKKGAVVASAVGVVTAIASFFI